MKTFQLDATSCHRPPLDFPVPNNHLNPAIQEKVATTLRADAAEAKEEGSNNAVAISTSLAAAVQAAGLETIITGSLCAMLAPHSPSSNARQ